MSGQETDIETWVHEKALRELGVPSLKLNVQGNRGYPDRVFWIDGGKPLLIEFKLPDEEPRPLQAAIHESLIYRGYNVQVHDNREEAFQAIRAAMAAANAGRAGGGPRRRTRSTA